MLDEIEPDERDLILVADDDEDIRRYVGHVLRRAGFAVIECGDGQEALQGALSNRPDLLLLDIGMPKLDGQAVWRIVRTLGAEAPALIFLTARTRAQDRLEGLDLGAADYIPKPFSSADLVERVRAVLRGRALPDAASAI